MNVIGVPWIFTHFEANDNNLDHIFSTISTVQVFRQQTVDLFLFIEFMLVDRMKSGNSACWYKTLFFQEAFSLL